MLIMKKILSVVGITGGTFFLLVAAICVEEWFSDPAYAAGYGNFGIDYVHCSWNFRGDPDCARDPDTPSAKAVSRI